jgi:hypothetical protein
MAAPCEQASAGAMAPRPSERLERHANPWRAAPDIRQFVAAILLAHSRASQLLAGRQYISAVCSVLRRRPFAVFAPSEGGFSASLLRWTRGLLVRDADRNASMSAAFRRHVATMLQAPYRRAMLPGE